METTEVMLRVDHLSKSFGTLRAVDDLSFEVHRGEIFGLLGPNGAGKSTTIKLLCRLLVPDSGSLQLRTSQGGSPKGDYGRTTIGWCPQELIFWGHLSCLENLVFLAGMYDIPRSRARPRARELLEALALADQAKKPAATLSGGMQRRLNLAMALIHDPELVILDEPEAGLDPQSRVLVREFVRSLARKKTVILTTHDMDEAQRLSDRLAILDHGRLLACDTPDGLTGATATTTYRIEIRYRTEGPQHPITEAFHRLVDEGFQVHMDEELSVIVVATNHESDLTRVLALGAELASDDIRMRRSNLEDVFLQLTGRGVRP